MQDPSFPFIDPGTIADDVVELRLLATAPADPAREEVPTYHFAIVELGSGHHVGGLNFRVGLTPFVVNLRGQVGYSVDAEHRGRGYAARACRLLLPFAHANGLSELWITCNPDNIASRRTLERVGATLVEIVDVPTDIRMYADGLRQKCRYRIALGTP